MKISKYKEDGELIKIPWNFVDHLLSLSKYFDKQLSVLYFLFKRRVITTRLVITHVGLNKIQLRIYLKSLCRSYKDLNYTNYLFLMNI